VSLADALAAPAATPVVCPIPSILDSLAERDAAALRAAFEPRGFSRERIYLALTREGIQVSRGAIEAHRAAVALSRGLARRTMPCSCHSPTS
jgi:hypothetical protein